MKYTAPVSFTDKLFYLFDVTFQRVNALFRSSPRTFIDIETIEDSETVVLQDGSLLTAVSIEGASKAILADEFADTLDELSLIHI